MTRIRKMKLVRGDEEEDEIEPGICMQSTYKSYNTIDIIGLARSLERSDIITCRPFPNVLFALRYILIHGPHPMVR